MPRMFDILRNNGQNKPEDKEEKPLPQEKSSGPREENGENLSKPSLNFPKIILKEEVKQEDKESQDHSLVSKKLILAVKHRGIDDREKSSQTFQDTVETINILLEKVRAQDDLCGYMDKIYACLDTLFNQLILGDSILENIYRKEEDGEYYLPFHITKVLILSSVIGINMGLNKSTLNHLGLAAVFSDVGLDFLREITLQRKKLTEEEYNLVKTHISKSLEITKKITGINDVAKETIRMHHERANGKGYPHFINSDGINPYAKIIGLVDTFTSITNNRPHRKGMSAHQAIRFLIGRLRDYFDPEVMKIFINKLSVYPIGSIVRLDTQEFAKVISVQSGSPLRPVVMIIQDACGEPVKEKIILDLSKQDSPSIEDPDSVI